jgi:hypothetical protein
MTTVSLHRMSEVNVKPGTQPQLRHFTESYVAYSEQMVGCNLNTNHRQPRRKQSPPIALTLARGLIQISVVRNHSHAICQRHGSEVLQNLTVSNLINAPHYKIPIFITGYLQFAIGLNLQPHKSIPQHPILVP